MRERHAAAETTRLRSAAGHGTWTIRTVSAGPTSCVGAVHLLTSDKMWRRRRSVCGRSRQHQFLHGPSKLMGPCFSPGNGHVSALSPWRMAEIAPQGDFPWPYVHPVAPSLKYQPPLRAQMSAARRTCGRAVIALRRRCAGCRPGGAAPRTKVLSWPLIPSRRYSELLWSTSGQKGPRRRKRRWVPANPGRRAGDAARETAAERAVGRAGGDLPPRPPSRGVALEKKKGTFRITSPGQGGFRSSS